MYVQINLGNQSIHKQTIFQLSDRAWLSMAIPTNANVDKEWATSLVGLRMKVPGSWWDNSDSSGHQLHAGKIHSIDFQKSQNRNQTYWQLQLDNVDEPDLYPMRYDTVLKYADECSPSYSSFRLPAQLVPNPVNETATIPSTSETESESKSGKTSQ